MKAAFTRQLVLALLTVLSACGGGQQSAVGTAPHMMLSVVGSESSSAVSVLQSPGFEENNSVWVVSTTGSSPVISTGGTSAHAGTNFARLGGYNNATDIVYQDVSIGVNTSQSTLQFWYFITTNESTAITAYDTMKVEIYNPQSGALLKSLATYSNIDVTSGWKQSGIFDLTSFQGQSVRLKFTVETDASSSSLFNIDDIIINSEIINTDITSTNPAIFFGKRSDYFVTNNTDGSITVKNTSKNTLNTLTEGTRLVFNDEALDFDITGFAGQVYRVYQAAFNRIPDSSGLGFWINAMDKGMSIKSIADGFVNSTEYKTLYGSNPTNNEVALKFYNNVLHRTPDVGGLNFWVGVLDRKAETVSGVLAAISESAENKALVLPNISNGISFTPQLVASCTLPKVLQHGVCVLPSANLTTVTGIISIGPVAGTTVNIYAINNGTKGNLLGNATSNALGIYEISVGAYTGLALIEASGGTYTDPATRVSTQLTATLRSAGILVVGENAMNVTPFTEAALINSTSLNMAGGYIYSNLDSNFSNIKNIIGVDPLKTMPINPTATLPPNANTENMTYAAHIGMISQYIGDNSEKSFDFILTEIADWFKSQTFQVGNLIGAASNNYGANDANINGLTSNLGGTLKLATCTHVPSCFGPNRLPLCSAKPVISCIGGKSPVNGVCKVSTSGTGTGGGIFSGTGTGSNASQCLSLQTITLFGTPRQSFTNNCNFVVYAMWCHSPSPNPGTSSSVCGNNGKYYQSSDWIQPGKSVNNQFNLPPGTAISYGSCSGGKNPQLPSGSGDGLNGVYHCN